MDDPKKDLLGMDPSLRSGFQKKLNASLRDKNARQLSIAISHLLP
jgi:hypothetical protein